LNLVEKTPNSAKKIEITVIEKYSEFNTGLPYGSRSGFSTLLITSLKNFLIEPERQLFITWLNKNKRWLLDEFIIEGGKLSKEWLNINQEDIDNNKWEELFIPRRFFGCYIDLKLKHKIKRLEEKNLVQTTFISDEVNDLEKKKNGYDIYTSNHDIITSTKVVLSIGSIPTKQLWKNEALIEEDNLLLVNKPYEPELSSVINKIKAFVSKRKGIQTNVLIVGANASALELLYKINDFEILGKSNKNQFAFLSTQGTIPDAEIDFVRQASFKPHNLIELKKEDTLSAKAIAEATFKDLDTAESIKLGAASTVDIVSAAFGVLLNKLNDEELEHFACYYGNEIGKRQRCAGIHYSDVVHTLKEDKRFIHIAGRFNDLILDDNGDYLLKYHDTLTQKQIITHESFNIIINCIGNNNLESKKISALLKSIINKGYCKPNASKIGFNVNTSLESSKNLHIMGPLLAGNVIENKPVWHAEHCGRIIWLSKYLANKLFDETLENKQKQNSEPQFEVKCLEDNLDIEHYKLILNKDWANNIYYAYEHLIYFKNLSDSLKYFVLSKDGNPKIIMPVVLRSIKEEGDIEIISNNYYDAITPYGYSGPLYSEDVTEDDLKQFWQSIDAWYFENNVITEFIRFSLNQNYVGYRGLLVGTLLNVKGKILNNFEDLWTNFSPKVRNNYRKALTYNLEFKLFDSNFSHERLEEFFRIYTETMIRNDAKGIYFFSFNYFKELISHNPNNFVLAKAYYENKCISAELIIKMNDTIYAFLGGTDANYFKTRPNDFLRVEIIKWAVENNIKYYTLGGGLNDNDGLYKHKKSLFPKDDDIMFYTGRKIINHEVYDQLCENNNEDCAKIHKEDFFPLYRFNNR
jgi:uncharacterized NAD(P)/FAD-binding protein YdhS